MKKEIIIDAQHEQERQVVVLENDILEEYYIERIGVQKYVGSIFKGIVESVVPAMHAAFINVGLEKNGFIHIDDINRSALDHQDLDAERKPASKKISKNIADILKKGQEIWVQVVKEPMGTKGVRLTTDLSIPSRFLVLLPFEEKQMAISKKVSSNEERTRLKNLLTDSKLSNYGLIIRTAAENCSNKEFKNDIQYLLNTWESIEEIAKTQKAPVQLYQDLDIGLKTIRDLFAEDETQIITNNKEEYKRILDFVKKYVSCAKKEVQFYQDSIPIFEKKNVQKDIDRTYRRKVWLKCGGYLCIDHTEAMVVIDVNSGRHTSSDNTLESTVTQANLEAADEIARQLRLRNTGGLIVIDFIDMKERKNQQAVILRLQAALRKDKAKSSLLPISEFGLVEMTRQRQAESVMQSVYDTCKNCGGRGLIKSQQTICLDVLKQVNTLLANSDERDIRIDVNPEVMDGLYENIKSLELIEKKYNARITISVNNKLCIEDIRLYDTITGKSINHKK